MDDISKALGISKKTLYQAVPNKAGLVRNVLDRFIQQEHAQIMEFKEMAKDPIHELVLMAKHVTLILMKLSPATIHDLKKYYVEQWQNMEAERSQMILQYIRNNLKKGMEQNIYRDDLDLDLLTDLYLRMATFISDEKIFERPAAQRVLLYIEFIKYHIRGIATPKGIKLYNKYEHLLKG